VPGGFENSGIRIQNSEFRIRNSERDGKLWLVSAAAHHFVSSSLASQVGLLAKAGTPALEIHPDDARPRAIASGDEVIVENSRGSCRLRAVVTDRIRPGVVATPKGYWAKHQGGRNVNWTTPDELGDMAGQSTFHHNAVAVRKAGRPLHHSAMLSR
jgi:anaerobic selenocysteine-containing dehydrogenase